MHYLPGNGFQTAQATSEMAPSLLCTIEISPLGWHKKHVSS